MQKLKILIAVTAAAFIGLSLNLAKHYKSTAVALAEAPPVAEDSVDPVVESFLRDLDRRPTTMPRIRRDAIDDDILYKSLNEIHWTSPAEPTIVRSSRDAAEAE